LSLSKKRYAAGLRASIQNLPKILAHAWEHRRARWPGDAFISDIPGVHRTCRIEKTQTLLLDFPQLLSEASLAGNPPKTFQACP
jgi:hypothetical protein